MLKYQDFLLESTIYNLVLESKVEFSKNFISILSAVKHPIAKAILSLQSQDKDVQYNYIDADIKTNDMTTFIQDRRAQAMTKGHEDIYKITNASKHLKFKDFQKEEGKTQNTEIYNLLGLNIDEAKKASQGEEVKILGKITSPFDSNKVYAAYEGIKDPTYKAVINVEGIEPSSEVFKKLWTTNRNPLKIGRLINALLPLTGQSFSDSEKEKFVSEWKSVLGVMNDAFSKFDIVEGNKLVHFYHVDNYEEDEGTLGNSCMSEASGDMLAIYSDNPKVCKLVIKYSDNGSIVDGRYKASTIVARALLWTLTNGEKFLDRVYTIDASDEELFKKYAETNGWWCKKSQNSSQNFTAQKGAEYCNPTWVVQLDNSYNDEYPYLDTFCYLNDDSGKLSNSRSEINANKLLNDTGGGYDYVDDDDDDD